MAGMSHKIYERTDALGAAGNTTAAIRKVEMFFYPFVGSICSFATVIIGLVGYAFLNISLLLYKPIL
jgi:Na+/H+-translocating membrane pyrophosphatase